MLAERRVESLAETERIEFGPPAVAAIAKAIASSPFLMQDNLADVLVELQDAFYAFRDELTVDVPDAEIVEGWEIASTPTKVMRPRLQLCRKKK